MNLLCKQLDSLACVTENYSLGDLKLVEESCETMQLLFFFEIRVVLSQSLQSQLISGLDKLWPGYVLLLETFDLLRIGGTEQSNLRLRHNVNDLFDYFSEVLRQQLVNFIQYK